MATTASEYYFFDSGAGSSVTESGWRKAMGGVIQTGVIPSYLNELEVYGDSTGMQCKIKTGACWLNGHYGENSTSVQTISLAASHATLHRYDLIVARANYTTNVVEWDVIQGTNSASPTVPTVTSNSTQYELALAYVYVAATVTTITAANVTDQRGYHRPISKATRAIVQTTETSTSTSYTRLATTTDEVTLTVPASGIVFITAKARSANNGVNYNYLAISMSGANTLTAANAETAGYYAQETQMSGSNYSMIQLSFVYTGLTPGRTTFSMNYKTSASTCSFGERIISVIPL